MSDQLSNDLASLSIQRDAPSGGRRALRLVLGGLAFVGIALATYFFVVPYVSAHVFKTSVSVTEIALVSPAQTSTLLTATGYVVPQVVSRIGTKVPGRVAHVFVREGDAVEAGAKLLQLEDGDQQTALAAAETRVLAARARAEVARANLAEFEQQLERQEKLVERGAAPRTVAEDLRVRTRALAQAVKAADAEARVAGAESKTLEVNLNNFTIRSPLRGTIISKPPQAGDLVAQGPVLELADFSSLVVEADIPEARLHLVRAGSPCEIVLDAFPERRERGVVTEIGQRINRAKATVTVRVRFLDSTKGVLPDMAARVSFLSKELDAESVKVPPKLVVPAAAVAQRSGAQVVFVVGDTGSVRMTPVLLGPPLGPGFEVQRGPPPGTRVVKNPPPALADGQQIKETSE